MPRRDADPRVASQQIDPRPGAIVVDLREPPVEDHQASFEHQIGVGEGPGHSPAAEPTGDLPDLERRAVTDDFHLENKLKRASVVPRERLGIERVVVAPKVAAPGAAE